MKEIIIEEFEEQNKKVCRTNCKFCNQEIKGNSKSQIEYLLLQHKIAKHRDKIEIKEMKK